MDQQMPFNIYSAAQTRELDAAIVAAGTPGRDLMQRAAQATWKAIQRHWPSAHSMTVLCGSGNNAGDGYLVARLAHMAGWQVRLLAVTAVEALEGDARLAWQRAAQAGVPIQPWQKDEVLDGIIVDALLGTGASGEVREPVRQVIEAINDSGQPVVAVDIPSGLDADRGCTLGVAVNANLTVTFIALKLGLFTAEGPDHVGKLEYAALVDVVEEGVSPLAERLVREQWRSLVPDRPRAAHKGMFGHLLLIGGDHGMGGAIMLAAQTALRSGAGRVSVITRPEHVAPLLTRCPEVMVHGLDDPQHIDALLDGADALVVGPGMGRSDWSAALMGKALASPAPSVFDADALNAIAQRYPEGIDLGMRALITPHPAEAARLLGWSTAEVQADRLRAVNRLVQKFSCAVLLKGVGTLVAGPENYARPPGLCSDGNPGMATAGMGDVLSGLAGALLAQGIGAGDVGRYAALVHAQAGDRAAKGGQTGILATDLIRHIRDIINGG